MGGRYASRRGLVLLANLSLPGIKDLIGGVLRGLSQVRVWTRCAV